MSIAFTGGIGPQPFTNRQDPIEVIEANSRVVNQSLLSLWLATPLDFRVESRSETSTFLSWTNQHGAGVTGIKIERALGDGAFSVIATLTDLTKTTYEDTGLATATRYRYRISVTDD